MRLLVTGGSGMVGSAIAVEAASRGFVTYVTYNNHRINVRGCQNLRMDLTNATEVESALEAIAPDITIHSAAMTDADLCEVHPEKAYEVNVRGSESLARGAVGISSRLVYISTNFVFDGKKGLYSEKDDPQPINVYGQTKLEGERAVCRTCRDFVVVRITPFGWDPGSRLNFVCWVLSKLNANEAVEAYRDVYNSPMLSNRCAKILLDIALSGKQRLYHLAGPERLSRFQLARKVASVFGHPEELIKPITYSERRSSRITKVPRDTSLTTDRVVGELQASLPTAEEGLEAMKKLRDSSYLSNFTMV